MEVSHDKWWKLLIDHDANRADLRRATGITIFTMADRLGVDVRTIGRAIAALTDIEHRGNNNDEWKMLYERTILL